MQKKTSKTALKDQMSPAMSGIGMADPNLLTGSNITQFATAAQNLHLIELSFALGVNTAALYTKKGADSLNSTLSLLLRLYSAFPEHLPRFKTPLYESLMQKIIQIDPGFKPTHLGPLLGLEINSSFRLKSTGLEGSSPTVRSLAYLIERLITEDPDNWWIIKNTVEIEARARKLIPAEKVWQQGGWKKTGGQEAKPKKAKSSAEPKPVATSTAQAPLRRAK